MFGSSLRLMFASACIAGLFFNGSMVEAQPTPTPSAQSKAQVLIETQKRLDSPDPLVRYPAYEAALGSNDVIIRNLALSKAFVSNDGVVRNLAISSVLQRVKTLSIEIAAVDEIAKELQAQREEGRTNLSNEAFKAGQFLSRAGSVINFVVLQYDAKAQTLLGLSNTFQMPERIDPKGLDGGSLTGETLQLSVTINNVAKCQLRLTLGQAGIMSGPMSCQGQLDLMRGKAQLRLI